MKIVIRCDASFRIGSGHVMRCLALATALREKGADVHFICRALKGNLIDLIFNRGFRVHVLYEPDHSLTQAPDANAPEHYAWLEVEWQQDLNESIELITKTVGRATWLIVDHYAIDRQWESGMRVVAEKIMVIDDLADRMHDCDLLLDQNLFEAPEKRYADFAPETCFLLLGPKFALLRPEFRHARKFSHYRENTISRVLIYFGGNDGADLTKMALSAFCCKQLDCIHVDVVVSRNYQKIDALNQLAANRPKTRIYIQPHGFTELMLRADLSIGAGGTTTWERLCLNLDAIVITMAKNQVPLTEQLYKRGVVFWLGHKETLTIEKIQMALLDIVEKRKQGAQSSSGLVDGFGAMRSAEMIMPSKKKTLRLRSADHDDVELYFNWVNDPDTRRNSLCTDNITWHGHNTWFSKKISSQNTYMWVLINPQGLPVGQVRIEERVGAFSIAYSLDPFVRGRRWAEKLLKQGIELFRLLKPDAPLVADVKKNNVPSLKVFNKLGFRCAGQTGSDELIRFKY